MWTIVDKSLVRPNIDDSREGYFLSKYTWVVTCRQLSFVAQAFDSEDKMADGHRTVIKTKVAGLIGNTMPFLHSQLTLRYSTDMLNIDIDSAPIFAFTGPTRGSKSSAIWRQAEQPGIELDPGLLFHLTKQLFAFKADLPNHRHCLFQVLKVVEVEKQVYKPELKDVLKDLLASAWAVQLNSNFKGPGRVTTFQTEGCVQKLARTAAD